MTRNAGKIRRCVVLFSSGSGSCLSMMRFTAVSVSLRLFNRVMINSFPLIRKVINLRLMERPFLDDQISDRADECHEQNPFPDASNLHSQRFHWSWKTSILLIQLRDLAYVPGVGSGLALAFTGNHHPRASRRQASQSA